MNVSSFLGSTAAAISLVGAIGLAYAQTSPDKATTPAVPATTQDATPAGTAPMEPSTTTQGDRTMKMTTPNSGDASAEPAARTDRN